MSKALTSSTSCFETYWGFCCFFFSPQMLFDKSKNLTFVPKRGVVRGQDGIPELSTHTLSLIHSLVLTHIPLVQHEDLAWWSCTKGIIIPSELSLDNRCASFPHLQRHDAVSSLNVPVRRVALADISGRTGTNSLLCAMGMLPCPRTWFELLAGVLQEMSRWVCV